jgi:hypothetical protein
MLKFLLWFFIIGYLVYKIGGFLMKSMLFVFGRKLQNEYVQEQQRRNYNNSQSSRQSKKPADGNVHIDYIPPSEEAKVKKGKSFGDGEYVDYEEVK